MNQIKSYYEIVLIYKQRKGLQKNTTFVLLLKNKSQKSNEYGLKLFLQKVCVWGKKKIQGTKKRLYLVHWVLYVCDVHMKVFGLWYFT